MFKIVGASLFCSMAFATMAQAQTCAIYPYTFANGTTADADQVNANFAAIRSCANTSLLPAANPIVTSQLGLYGVPGQQIIDIRDTTWPADTFTIAVGQYNGGTTLFQTLNTTNWELEAGFTNALFVNTAGNVGIHTSSPTYPLYVNGTAYATGAAGALSDRRHKTDIKPLDVDALDLVAQLKPVTFLWKEPADDAMKGRQIGFIAQDVLPLVPEVVLTQNNTEKTLGLKYDAFIPILTKAIQQQQQEIDRLNAANVHLAENVGELERRVGALERRVAIHTAQK